MSSGLDDLERRGRWGRNAAPTPRQPAPTAPSAPPAPPEPAPPARAKMPPKPGAKAPMPVRRATKPVEETPPAGVERVVVYLSPEQTAWIRERQIEGLRAGKRITTSKLIRELMDRAMR